MTTQSRGKSPWQLSFFFAATVLGPCRSELPPYQDPANVFTAQIAGLYVLTSNDNSLKVFLTAVNTFDETFQGEAVLQGQIDISLARVPSIHKTFSVSAVNLSYAKNYNSTTKSLTIDPGDSVKFMVSWNFVDNNGVDLRQSVFRYSPDPECSGRQIAAPEIFTLEGTVKVYDRVESAGTKSTNFQMCHVSTYVPPNYCPPVLGCPR